MLSATQLMTKATALHQQGKLHNHELATLSLVVGRSLGHKPLLLQELDQYLPVGERQRRKYLEHLKSLGLLILEQRPDRRFQVIPLCTTQTTNAAGAAQPEPTPPPTKAKPKHVPIQPTDAWMQWLPAAARDRVHAVKAEYVTRVRKALKSLDPSQLDPKVGEKIRSARYPFGYLATVLTPTGGLQPHARRTSDQPVTPSQRTAPTCKSPKHNESPSKSHDTAPPISHTPSKPSEPSSQPYSFKGPITPEWLRD